MRSKASKIHRPEAQIISENLRALLKINNSTESKVAEALNIPFMTIRRLVSGETMDPRVFTLKLIADHFNVSIDTLISENKITTHELSQKNKPVFVPVLDWATIEQVKKIKEIDLKKWQNWHPISFSDDAEFGENIFGLESRKSMYPRFQIGTIFIIDPDASPSDGDIVLVRMKKNNEMTLRELTIDPPLWQLKPISTGSEVIEYSNKTHEIFGVVILTLLYNKK